MCAKILCIEDDADIVELVRLILEQGGFTVVGLMEPERACELALVERPDLILLDLMMPGMDGWEVYRRLKADPRLMQIPVVVLTAKAQSIDRALGLHIAKVDDYITKPFAPDELLGRIRSVLGQRQSGAGALDGGEIASTSR